MTTLPQSRCVSKNGRFLRPLKQSLLTLAMAVAMLVLLSFQRLRLYFPLYETRTRTRIADCAPDSTVSTHTGRGSKTRDYRADAGSPTTLAASAGSVSSGALVWGRVAPCACITHGRPKKAVS